MQNLLRFMHEMDALFFLVGLGPIATIITMSDATNAPGGNQALARGLRVLELLVEAPEPMTATAIAHQIGLHQSSVSRILATLTDEGYAHKVSYARFAADFGLLSLATATIPQFPLVSRPRAAMEKIAATADGFSASLGTLWNGRMIYFLRTSHQTPTIDFWASDYPIHLSAPGLRLLADLQRDAALGILRGSRERFGWRGEAAVPSTEEEVLDRVNEQIAHDVLVLPGWRRTGETGAAIPIVFGGQSRPLALALSGPDQAGVDAATLRLWLHDGRRLVEHALDA